jgi:hypothetical protein
VRRILRRNRLGQIAAKRPGAASFPPHSMLRSLRPGAEAVKTAAAGADGECVRQALGADRLEPSPWTGR